MKLPVIKPLYHLLRWCGAPVVWEVSVGSPVFRWSASGEREYLVLRYPSGHYDFPKGHIEPGETEEDTLRREVAEETGLTDVNIYAFRTSIKYFYRAHGTEAARRLRERRGTWIFKQVHYYPALAHSSDVILSHEHTGFLWIPYRQALEMVTFENARRVLRGSEAYLEAQAHATEQRKKN
jgi:8-oxo-dGTP pyrophosphatase MutT (NUDIX family)